jgi:hypothetical protein
VKAAVWFEAQGRSAYSRGLPLNYGRSIRVHLPMWARQAWARGWITQGSCTQMTKTIVDGFEQEAGERGISLRATVTDFLSAEGATP